MKSTLLLLKNTPEDLWAVSVKDPTARGQLKSLTADTQQGILPIFRVLIAYVDQLHDFVQHVPPLAWELLEYAQEPLEIVYPKRKFTVSDDDDAPQICVRWAKQPKLLRYLQKAGPVWAIPTSFCSSNPLPPAYIIDCRDKNAPYLLVKTVAISTDDTFAFLR